VTGAVGAVSPVVSSGEIVSRSADEAVVRYQIAEDDQIFAGHYPGFPIYPGVCLVECVHKAALDTTERPLALRSVESTRFVGATFPGDEITVALRWKQIGTDWQCNGEITSERGKAATVRLRYRTEESR
jgi:3-hydroxyacyl-[acyl-carrier-protein] dehydratase